MTDAVAVALIAGMPLTIAALGALWTTLRTKADTQVILGHVNSEKTAAEGRENTLKSENTLLREMLAERKATAGLLAQAAATAAVAPPAAVGGTAVTESLSKIDTNTAETATNTKKTDAAVKTLQEKL